MRCVSCNVVIKMFMPFMLICSMMKFLLFSGMWCVVMLVIGCCFRDV